MRARATVLYIAISAALGCAEAAPSSTDAGGTRLAAGREVVVERTLGRVETGEPAWLVSPFLHEVDRVCPLPEGIPTLRAAHHALALEASEDVVVTVSLARTGGSTGADTGVALYRTSRLPSTPDEMRACAAVGTNSTSTPTVLEDVEIDAGTPLLVVVWNPPSIGPTDYRLVVRAR